MFETYSVHTLLKQTFIQLLLLLRSVAKILKGSRVGELLQHSQTVGEVVRLL